VWRPTVRLRPFIFSFEKGWSRDEIFSGDEAFERGEPMLVIARTVIGIAASAGCGEFLGERG
jgi:hypothetical protein